MNIQKIKKTLILGLLLGLLIPSQTYTWTFSGALTSCTAYLNNKAKVVIAAVAVLGIGTAGYMLWKNRNARKTQELRREQEQDAARQNQQQGQIQQEAQPARQLRENTERQMRANQEVQVNHNAARQMRVNRNARRRAIAGSLETIPERNPAIPVEFTLLDTVRSDVNHHIRNFRQGIESLINSKKFEDALKFATDYQKICQDLMNTLTQVEWLYTHEQTLQIIALINETRMKIQELDMHCVEFKEQIVQVIDADAISFWDNFLKLVAEIKAFLPAAQRDIEVFQMKAQRAKSDDSADHAVSVDSDKDLVAIEVAHYPELMLQNKVKHYLECMRNASNERWQLLDRSFTSSIYNQIKDQFFVQADFYPRTLRILESQLEKLINPEPEAPMIERAAAAASAAGSSLKKGLTHLAHALG